MSLGFFAAFAVFTVHCFLHSDRRIRTIAMRVQQFHFSKREHRKGGTGMCPPWSLWKSYEVLAP